MSLYFKNPYNGESVRSELLFSEMKKSLHERLSGLHSNEERLKYLISQYKIALNETKFLKEKIATIENPNNEYVGRDKYHLSDYRIAMNCYYQFTQSIISEIFSLKEIVASFDKFTYGLFASDGGKGVNKNKKRKMKEKESFGYLIEDKYCWKLPLQQLVNCIFYFKRDNKIPDYTEEELREIIFNKFLDKHEKLISRTNIFVMFNRIPNKKKPSFNQLSEEVQNNIEEINKEIIKYIK